MKKVPVFVPNTPDDLHCVPAVFRMLNKYYFDEDLTWGEIDRIMKVVPGKGTWTFPGLTYFAKKGLRIVHVEPVDYEALYREGPVYLKKVLGEKSVDYHINKSNLPSVIKDIPEYISLVHGINRKSSIEEIIKYLKDEYLIGMEVDSRALNNKQGFSLHYVLIYDFDGKYFILHDPGLPPLEARKVSIEEFSKAFDYEGAGKSMTAFKKPTVKPV